MTLAGAHCGPATRHLIMTNALKSQVLYDARPKIESRQYEADELHSGTTQYDGARP